MMMKQIGFLLTFLLIALCAVQVGTHEAKPKCTNKGGTCQEKAKAAANCKGPIRTGDKFCTDHEKYDCCTNCTAGTKDPCEELNGICINADATCDGSEFESQSYCKQKDKGKYLCKCCYPTPAVECGISNPSSTRVINGVNVTDARKYSWQVGLSWHDKPYKVRCGGSIITDKHILTAAHCFNRVNKYFVGIGSNKQDNTMYIIPQAKVFIHEDYDHREHDYDIAIIELSEPIDLVKNRLSPICIPKDANNDYNGLTATVSGWGSTVGYNRPPPPNLEPHYPNILQEAQLPVLNNTKCEEDVKHLTDLTDRMLCAGDMKGFENGGKDSCQADSGGPLTLQENGQYQQIGIVSFGDGCASKGHPGVYARVTKFLDWINEKVAPEKVYKSS